MSKSAPPDEMSRQWLAKAARWTRRAVPPGAASLLLKWLGLAGFGQVLRALGGGLLALAAVLASVLVIIRQYTNSRVGSVEPELFGRLPWLEAGGTSLFGVAAAALVLGARLAATFFG